MAIRLGFSASDFLFKYFVGSFVIPLMTKRNIHRIKQNLFRPFAEIEHLRLFNYGIKYSLMTYLSR